MYKAPTGANSVTQASGDVQAVPPLVPEASDRFNVTSKGYSKRRRF